MNNDEYLKLIIGKYQVKWIQVRPTFEMFRDFLKPWAKNDLVEIMPSGSIVKGTAITLSTDLDIFISLTSKADSSLGHIYESLYNYLLNTDAVIKKQNVSIGVQLPYVKVDLIPARRLSQQGYDHSVFKNKAKSWTKTNINKHISYVKNSHRIGEIMIMKIWREQYKLDFPSFYLEMSVIDCLKGKKINDLYNNVMAVFYFLTNGFILARYVDPSNSENIISGDLTLEEKQKIISAAQLQLFYYNPESIVS